MKKEEGIQTRLKPEDNEQFRTLVRELIKSTPSKVLRELIKEFNQNKSLQNRLKNRIIGSWNF